jgi:hypothetical protein
MQDAAAAYETENFVRTLFLLMMYLSEVRRDIDEFPTVLY